MAGGRVVMKINKKYIMFPVYAAAYKAGKKSLNDIARKLGRRFAIIAYKNAHRVLSGERYWSRSLSRWISANM